MNEKGNTNQIKLSKEDMPYERFLQCGASALTDAELLAVIIRVGTRRHSAVEIGREILNLCPDSNGLLGLHHLSVEELMQVEGIGQVQAVKIKCISELSMRMSKEQARKQFSMTKPASIADAFMEQLRHEEVEKTLLLMFDNKMHLLKETVISTGTVSMAALSPREVFITALKYKAVTIILLHNHPSGDPAPSTQDISITEKIRQIGDMIQIRLMDHIIIGDQRYLSLKEAGYI